MRKCRKMNEKYGDKTFSILHDKINSMIKMVFRRKILVKVVKAHPLGVLGLYFKIIARPVVLTPDKSIHNYLSSYL